MASPAARTTDSISSHAPCGPGQCGIGSENVIIENKLAYRVGDRTFPHSYPVTTTDDDGNTTITCVPHVTVLTKGSSKVMVNNRPAGRIGDTHTCGSFVTTGASKVIIGG
jgi:uncharacterized Zn-binding protein involved in type VI secretion